VYGHLGLIVEDLSKMFPSQHIKSLFCGANKCVQKWVEKPVLL
jgi:hypothetical protein